MARRKVSSKKTPATKKAVAKRKSTAVGSVADMFQQGLETELGREQMGAGKTLSIRNSKFKFEGADLGSEISVVLLDYVFVNQYFKGKFDPDNRQPPACFAMAENEQDLVPLPSSPEIQNGGDPCVDCWANEFESDDAGRGKACKNGRRLAVMSAEAWEDDDFADFIDSDAVGYLTLPPTTNPTWRAYVNKLGKTAKLPVWGVITTLSFDPDVDYPKLEFTATSKLQDVLDEKGAKKLLTLRDEIHDELRAVPDFSGYDDKDSTKKKTAKKRRKVVAKKGSVRKKKRAGSKSKFA
jgi:hypothetical protein